MLHIVLGAWDTLVNKLRTLPLWNLHLSRKLEQKVNMISRHAGASLVVQWLRIHLLMQGTRVRSLVQEVQHATRQ